MENTINQIIHNIDSIKNSLEIISTKGIPIIDTYANISTWINMGTAIVSTFIGTVIGTRFTMELFKSQENMRIKEEFRINFYKGYKPLYDKLYYSLLQFKLEVSVAYRVNKESENKYFELKELNLNDRITFNYDLQKVCIKEVIEQASLLNSAMYELSEYIKINKRILIDYTQDLFEEPDVAIRLIKLSIDEIEMNYKEIDFMNNYHKQQDKKELERLKEENKKFIDYINKMGSEIGQNNIEQIKERIESINLGIENEFIGNYFKPKKQKKICKKDKI